MNIKDGENSIVIKTMFYLRIYISTEMKTTIYSSNRKIFCDMKKKIVTRNYSACSTIAGMLGTDSIKNANFVNVLSQLPSLC